MFPFNSNPFRLRLFQSQKLYNNLCKLYAIFLAWFKIHGFLEAKYIFSEKLILSSFKWDIALITSVNTVDKKNKRKKVTIICHFFSVDPKELGTLNWIKEEETSLGIKIHLREKRKRRIQEILRNWVMEVYKVKKLTMAIVKRFYRIQSFLYF